MGGGVVVVVVVGLCKAKISKKQKQKRNRDQEVMGKQNGEKVSHNTTFGTPNPESELDAKLCMFLYLLTPWEC